MSEVRFRARGSDGRVAIYTGADDAPFDAPLSNLARVQFHSDLLYPKIIAQVSTGITLPARPANYVGTASFNLFSHGRPGTPLVLGYTTLGSTRVHLCGSVPVQATNYGWARWVSIGSDATYVKVGEACFSPSNTAYGSFGAIYIPIQVYVLDALF